MKKLPLLITFMFIFSGSAFAMYDFMEPYDEYQMFKEYYDLNTEYWKYIPNHLYYEKSPDIKLKNVNNTKPERRVITKENNKNNNSSEEIIIK